MAALVWTQPNSCFYLQISASKKKNPQTEREERMIYNKANVSHVHVLDVLSLLPAADPPPLSASSCLTLGFWLLLECGCLSAAPKSTESSETDWQRDALKTKLWFPVFYCWYKGTTDHGDIFDITYTKSSLCLAEIRTLLSKITPDISLSAPAQFTCSRRSKGRWL